VTLDSQQWVFFAEPMMSSSERGPVRIGIMGAANIAKKNAMAISLSKNCIVAAVVTQTLTL